MNWLDKLEYKYRRYAIPNLMKIVVIGQLIVWAVVMLLDQRLYGLLTLSRAGLAHFQLWRLVTFIFVPPLASPLSLAIELYLYYVIGTTLERQWGTFRFNVYYLLGMVGAVAACLITGFSSNSAINMSLFFAFAALYPDMQFLLFFLIPIKAKWLGIAGGVLYLWQFLQGNLITKVTLAFGLLNFFLFFGPALKRDYDNYKRRKQWQDQWR